MDPLQISLRILHILSGAAWLGGGLFLILLRPQLRRLGPAVDRPVSAALLRPTSPPMMATVMAGAFVAIGTGAALALILRWNSLDTFLSSGWGWAILIGFAAAMANFSLAPVQMPVIKRWETLLRSVQGRDPTPEEATELERLTHRASVLEWLSFALVLVAAGAMASARYV